MVQLNSLLASLVPIGILLGPMSLPFMWFSTRVDPEAASAPAGSAVQAVALVASDWPHPLHLNVPNDVTIDEATPAERSLLPLRETLDRLLALLRQPQHDPAQAWELQAIADVTRQRAADDLEAYLHAGISCLSLERRGRLCGLRSTG